ncbi:N-terminal nucleophile aminohydrolase, partial [Aureobasidium melanogenum]
MLHAKPRKIQKNGADQPCIFVHAGAGYHSLQNERIHLQACNDAAKAAMVILRTGGTALDAIEIAIKVLEDREITNAGYGSNLAVDGVVECDATIVDHFGRSGAVGAVSQIKNPISLARTLLDRSTQLLTLRRVPPNLLVGQGAIEFAASVDMPILPYDALVSPAAKERWLKWRNDLNTVEKNKRNSVPQTSSSLTAVAPKHLMSFDPE